MPEQKSKRISDLVNERLNQGFKKFGDELPVDDGREWLQEALEELLDAIIYVSNKLLLLKDTKPSNCIECGSTLGIDCGEAEPDYNEDFCSKGCYNVFILRYNT
tara:strand:- start:305 stop:616 length:312 start_codon:yes stop_codon:yes gene_type:complete